MKTFLEKNEKWDQDAQRRLGSERNRSDELWWT
ncbi:TPA: hypothetical protein PKO72_002161 [Aeromonas hydrophila]|nr:hypothetical protein [Aeromonas hydrophila]HDI1213434.1 hypothetical protein [Aeromonas hydrophila]